MIPVTAYAAPQGDSVDAFFAVVGAEPETAADLTVADVHAAISAGAPLQSDGERDTTSLMYVAGYNPDPDVMRALLAAGADVAVRDRHGWTALNFAAAFNTNPAVVRTLLAAGAETAASGDYEVLPARSVAGHSPVLDVISDMIDYGDVESPLSGGDATLMAAAAFNSNPEVIRTLLAAGVAVDEPIESGETALMAAAGLNTNPAVTQALLDGGAEVMARAEEGETALMAAAAFNENPDIVRVLLDAGADLHARDGGGETALMHAAANNENVDVIHALLDAGADVHARDEFGETVLMATAASNGNVAVIHALLDAGADPHAADDYGETALSAAASNENPDVIQALLDTGAELPPPNEYDGWTILMSAALSNRNPEALQALIDAGADPHARTEAGETALMIAASHNDRDVLQLLLDHGIEIDARDREGWSALMAAAAFNQDPQVGRLLLAAGAETKPGGSVGTRALIMPGWPEEITAAGEAIGEAGIAAFELTPGGEPAVLVAALYGQNLDVLQALIDAGADILGAHTKDGWTTAMAAAFNPNPDVMQFLIDAEVDIHARTRQGWTAVRYADRFNPNSLVTQTLLDAGARLEPGAAPVETAATPAMTCAGSVAVGEAPNSAELISDCEALLRASDALDGGAGVLNWDLDRRIGDWMGVSLRADRVIGLDLREAGLQGRIPQVLVRSPNWRIWTSATTS